MISSINFIIDFQNYNGSWFYSNNNNFHIDLLHSAYVLEGLLKTRKNLEGIDNISKLNKKIDNSINKGISFILENFTRKDGSFKERALLNLDNLKVTNCNIYLKHKLISLFKYLNLYQEKETRLWGYAAFLRVVSLYNYIYNDSIDISDNLNYILNNLYNDKLHCFYYRQKEKHIFIRHQSHIFEALSMYIYDSKRSDWE